MKKYVVKNGRFPVVLVASFFLFILAGFLYSKPFKIPKEVKAVVGELNIGSTGAGAQTLGDLKITRGLAVGSYDAPTTAGNAIFSGNVGIGTTGPGAKLDVAGRIWQTGTGRSVFLGEGAGANDDLNNNNNAFVGYNAGYSNTTGYANSTMGINALHFNTTGSQNSAMGGFTLYSNTTGYYNSAMGVSALVFNTTGYQNSAMGANALYSNTTGYYNSAQGYTALQNNTTGSYNSAQGVHALYANTTGYYNSAQGYAALYNLTGAYHNNTALGFNAGRYYNGTTGSLTSHSTSLFLGASASALADSGSNEIVIGYNAIGNGSNSVTLGNTSITKTILNGNVGIGTTGPTYQLQLSTDSAAKPTSNTWTIASDARIKNVVSSYNKGLTELLKINPIIYTYKENNALGIIDPGEHVGIIAQEVQKIFPEAITTDDQGYLHFNSDALSWASINAIKELNTKIDDNGDIAGVQIVTDESTPEEAIRPPSGVKYRLTDTAGEIIDRIGAFAELVVAKIQSGLIETKKLIVDGVDILKKLNELSDKSDKQEKTIEAQQTQIDELKELIQAK